jgi:hypothetical protein
MGLTSHGAIVKPNAEILLKTAFQPVFSFERYHLRITKKRGIARGQRNGLY